MIYSAGLNYTTTLLSSVVGKSFIRAQPQGLTYTLSNSSMPSMLGSRMFTRQVLAILSKDLKVEWRTREIFTSMVVFAMLVVVVFNFAIGANPELVQQVAPGVLWVALLFATVLGLQRAIQMENEEDCLQGMLLTMGDRSALFVAKTVANMLYLFV